MKFKPPPKRKRVDPPAASSRSSEHGHVSNVIIPSHSALAVNLPSETKNSDTNQVRKTVAYETQTSTVSQMIQQLRNKAVAQAQQDGCTTNFRIFDSEFGNYLVPVIPTRSELGG